VDSASHAVGALIRRWGGEPRIHRVLPDDLDLTVAALRDLVDRCDIVLCIGGASVGKRDLMRPATAALDAQFRFERIAVQPGKPCWHARLGSSGLILGLPGNPSSAFVCAHLLLLPLIDKLMKRAPTLTLLPATSAAALPANGEREQYLRASKSFDEQGRLLALPIPDQDSGLQAALARSQLLIRRRPGATALDAGGPVDVLELSSF
jgi:molybdopterin molybdotransferase